MLSLSSRTCLFARRFGKKHYLPPRSLPEAWLDANDSFAYPVVHLQSTSSWLPELRSLLLGGNSMSLTGYTALQTIVNWEYLQALDLSDNALTGSVEDALTLYVCEGSGSTECGANTSSVGAPFLRVLKLDGNALTGEAYSRNITCGQQLPTAAKSTVCYKWEYGLLVAERHDHCLLRTQEKESRNCGVLRTSSFFKSEYPDSSPAISYWQ